MKKLVSIQQVKVISYCCSASFLVIHVLLYLLFFRNGVLPMAAFNVFSIGFYMFMFLVVKYGLFRVFVVGTFYEVILHMGLAVYFVGWNAGFQITLIGMNILAFFAEYFGRTMKIKYVSAVFLALTGLVAYLGIYIFNYGRPVPYVLPDKVYYFLNIIWAVVTFGIAIVCLQIFVLITFWSETILNKRVGQDELTGLPNRYYMNGVLEDLKLQDRLKDHWIAMADIDDFKKVNDNYGHNCGDYVLKTLADLLRDNTEDEIICRWGGEEFLILGKINNDPAYAGKRLEEIRHAVEGYDFQYENFRQKVTITIGMANYQDGRSIGDWISLADKRLYVGKYKGKNTLVGRSEATPS